VNDDDARVALFREHPPGWWGWPWRLPRPLTVPELIAAGSLDAPLAALLWVALERRASVIVAAGPNGAGKTVTLSALLEFLPPAVRRIHLQGMAEDFGFVADVDPTTTYLLANEISDHLPIYLWGRRAQRAFELLREGFALGATLHAASVAATLSFLAARPLAIPSELLAAVTLILVLAVTRRGGELRRRVAGVYLLDQDVGGVRAELLARWDAATDTHRLRLERPASALAARLGMVDEQLLATHAARAAWLRERVAAGEIGPAAFRAALAAYWAAGQP